MYLVLITKKQTRKNCVLKIAMQNIVRYLHTIVVFDIQSIIVF